jgi:hypothetical protein
MAYEINQIWFKKTIRNSYMERVTGIEPAYEAWEAAVLPLNYTRSGVPAAPEPKMGKGLQAAIIARPS